MTNSFIIQASACLKRDNRAAARGEKDRAVVTNEGISQRYNRPHASFIRRPAEVHNRGRCIVACPGINDARKKPRGDRRLLCKNHGNAAFERLAICPSKHLK